MGTSFEISPIETREDLISASHESSHRILRESSRPSVSSDASIVNNGGVTTEAIT
jgi:hypothetical protein